MTRYRLWLKIAAILLLLTAALHSLSFFNEPTGQNETEKQMINLITTYQIESGAGFKPTFYDLFTGISIGFSLLFIVGGLTLLLLLNKETKDDVLSGIITIYLLVYGGCFAACLYFTFLPPIICTGLIFLSLIIARMVFRKAV